MATIVETKEGSWRAIVRRKGRYASKTFRLKGQAKDWARDTEFNIDQGGEVTTPSSSKLRTFGQLVDLHVRDLKEVGKPSVVLSRPYWNLSNAILAVQPFAILIDQP